MSRGGSEGDVDVSHGGAIAVDTDALRAVASRVRDVGSGLDHAMRELRTVASGARGVELAGLGSSLPRMEEVGRMLASTVRGVEMMADAYEIIELRARARSAADSRESVALRRDADVLAARDPAAADAAACLLEHWRRSRFEGLGDPQPHPGALDPGAVWGAPWWMGLLRRGAEAGGVVLAGPPLASRPHTVLLAAASDALPAAAPTSLSEFARRFPSSPSQMRVEAYTMPSGARRYVAYIAGTQPGLDPAQPWDMRSNLELYVTRAEADSYQAARDALLAAGVRPGDALDLVGHSQGGMIAALLARTGEYDVQTLVTFGSPIEAEIPAEVLSVTVRHTDDPVAALAGGGSVAGTGAPGSVVITRVGDPQPGFQDLLLRTHRLSVYAGTAAMADASGDPRIAALHSRWAALRDAVPVAAVDYTARRP